MPPAHPTTKGPMNTTETDFGTAAGLSDWLGRQLDPNQADQALAAAQGVVRSLCRQYLSYVADEQLVMDWRGDLALYLPELPVTDVSAVEARQLVGDGADPNTWTPWPEGQLQWSQRTGELRLACMPFAGWGDSWPTWWGNYPGVALGGIRVTYSHGYDPVPPELIGVVYGIAGRMLAAPDGRQLGGETIGAYSYTTDAGGLAPAGGSWAAGLSGPEAAIIANYRTFNRA